MTLGATGHVSFRPLDTQPGQLLLEVIDPHEAGIRFGHFLSESGLAPEDVVATNLTGTPLPLYPAIWPDGKRRWNGTKGSFMWHPLCWLPERLACRARLNFNGEVVVENDELWAARVLAEMTASGLYSEAEGGWVDVLSLHGLDSFHPATWERVEAWLDGGDDPLLDSIDLTEHLTPGDGQTDWAFPIAMGAVEELRPVAWSIHAESLLADVDDIIELGPSWEPDNVLRATRSVLALASMSFMALPHEFDPAWWASAYTSGPATVERMLNELLPQAAERMKVIIARFYPMALAAADGGALLSDQLATDPDSDSDLIWS